ncbi:hypothetical protein LARI1_G007471 [Lachnellula arida]|uniref:Amidohydrolase 3 domain-containing protein n=1 Tax=Lachnellula arida TaxID=1316785 RepID=A0A8T9B3K1_9HELO|nr:hypothetical protein LARI1_G007471 [Lachnellula arida]
MAYALARLGEERLAKSAYRMCSLFPPPSYPYPYPGPVLGSDFPVEPPSPFAGIWRRGWFPDEKLSVEQALRGFTTNGAYGWLKEDVTGAIEVGKWADWVVVDRDIFEDESGKSLRDVAVRSTWVGGKNVFSSKQAGDRGQPGFLKRLEKFTVCVVERIQGSRATCGWPIIGARE